MDVLAGATDITTYFNLRLSADGTAATGITISELDLQYVRSGDTPAAKVDAVALAATNTAHTDNRAIEIDATDQPGLYRVDWPDAAFASGVREVILTVKHTTTFIEHLRVNLTAVPSVSASGAALATAADLTTLTGLVDSEVAQILADTNELQTDWTNGGRLDSLIDTVITDTTQIKADLPTRPTRGVQLDDVMFMMVDATDFNTPETGITVTATISKDGGAFAACSNSVSEVSGGWYKITLTASEMTATSIALKFTGSGCAQRNLAIRTQPT